MSISILRGGKRDLPPQPILRSHLKTRAHLKGDVIMTRWGLKAELDRERGIYVYEVEFRSGRYEYDYTINATTGKVISFDKEYDD